MQTSSSLAFASDSMISPNNLSPGSGSLASACLSQGLVYHGIVGNASHMGWLMNVLDRESLQYICRAGHPLYQEDLATRLKESTTTLAQTSFNNRSHAAMDFVSPQNIGTPELTHLVHLVGKAAGSSEKILSLSAGEIRGKLRRGGFLFFVFCVFC